MSDKKEFENLLAALGERELSEWEVQRLWQLIGKDSSRLDEYLNIQNMNMALANIEFNVVEHKAKEPKPKKTNRLSTLALAASFFIAILGLAWLVSPPETSPQKVEPIVAITLPEPQPETKTPVDAYQKMLSQIPKQGSMNRPPTSFTNINNPSGSIRFNESIRPILSENCFACHGADAKNAEGDLRLDSLEAAIAAGAIVPGKPDESELVHRIMTTDSDDLMPPPDSHKKLTQEEKDLLRQWIVEGAQWEEHWAFVKPNESKFPKDFSEHPIDHFIKRKLKQKGLTLNDKIDRYALARRVSFDLIGLPPTWEDVNKFANDDSEKAYEKYLDELFKSPRYGEHQARFWMDAARYGDTHGMHLDNYREMWPYRDWVIQAFNNNMPFDQFTVEQIAGDLLPSATDSQIIATGFNRCNVTTSEGGSIPEELDVRYMIDRIEAVGTVFMGLTLGCAACHDHKFDPISQKEFYQFGAFFNNTTQPAMDGNQKDSPPVLTIPSEQNKKEWSDLLTKRKTAFAKLDQRKKPKKESSISWLQNYRLDSPIRPHALHFEAMLGDDNAMVNGKPVKVNGSSNIDHTHPSGSAHGAVFSKDQEKGLSIQGSPTLHSDQPFTVSMWLRTPDLVRNSTLLSLGNTYIPPKDSKKKKNSFLGLQIKLSVQGAITPQLSFEPYKTISSKLAGEMGAIPNSWQHICIRYSGGLSKTSIRVAVNGKDLPLRQGNQGYINPKLSISGNIKLGQGLITGGLSHIRLYNRYVNDAEMKLLANEFKLNELAKKSELNWSQLPAETKDLLSMAYLENEDEATIAAQNIITKTQARRDYIYSRSTTTLVMEEKKDSQPFAYILDRGEYDQRKEKVTPDVPKVFLNIDSKFPKNRLGLAHWLVDKNNPLTARVTVNRLWESIFGTGLVKTSSDFGTMGTPPTHPELLDWLALEFIKSGWNVQHILKLMVTSDTYQQNAIVSEKSLNIDPENKWLSRGPRVRLDAEEIRDQALAISGLLKHQLGGPSVKPYQPKGLWKVVAFAGSNTKDFRADKGDKLYRRSLYTFWKRTSPPPSMEAFNAPTRENCTVSRERTNTPLQALVLMNDPQFVEAARFLAQRAIKEQKDEAKRVRWMLREALQRPVIDIDVKELLEASQLFKTQFKQAPEVVSELLKVGDSPIPQGMDQHELATWSMIANIIMNRDDFINKD